MKRKNIGLYLITLEGAYPPTRSQRIATVQDDKNAKGNIDSIIRLKFPSVTWQWVKDSTIYGYYIRLSDDICIELR